MSLAHDPTGVLDVFLHEAEEILADLEHGSARLQAGAEPTPAPLGSLLVLAHRLKGAAALHGFRQLSYLAGTMEEILERAADEAGDPAVAPGVGLIEPLTTAIRRSLEAIRSTGMDPRDRWPAPTAPDPDTGQYFVPEALGYLDTLRRCLLALEQAPDNDDELAKLFRTTHTLKGAAYVVGWTKIGDLAHRMEDVLAAIRAPRSLPVETMIDALRAAVATLHGLLAGGPAATASATPDDVAARLGVLAGPASTVGGPPLATSPASGSTGPVRDTAASSLPGARSARRRAEERLERLLALVGELVMARMQLEHDVSQLERLGEHLSAGQSRLAGALEEFEASLVPTAGEGLPPWRHLLSATAGPAAGSTGGPPLPWLATDPPAPLHLDRYDHYDLLSRRAQEIGADLGVVRGQLAGVRQQLGQDAARIQQLTGRLRGELLHTRLVPMRKLFSRVARQVRDLAAAAGKTVSVNIRGEAVDIDHIVVERMADPLLHLTRNAIAHGIEEPADRQARGKPPGGTLSLTAYQRGGSVVVEVQDDGQGIDSARLKSEAVRQGLLPREVAAFLEGPEALDLVFLPGLSTAPTVTSAAGRGIGLDAVRAEVAALSGEISVETELGVGTRFTIRLPLTLASSDALVVRVGTEMLAIPVTAIRRIERIPPESIRSAGPGDRIRVENHAMELIRLDRLLGLPAPEPTQPVPVVVLGAGGEPVAVAVSDLVSKEEIVIKGLGEFLEGVGPFAGGTVSAEGRAILVLDTARLREAGRTSGTVGSDEAVGTPASLADTRAILLVDDSISVRKFVGQMLTRSGFTVHTARDGAEALTVLEATHVSLVITDLEMPRLNGFELIQELRRRPTTRDLPIVVLTTRAGAQHLSLARWLGVSKYVSKPIDEQEFVSSIAALTCPPSPHA